MTLNEGGGLHPRNPDHGLQDDAKARSMKAGAFTPATRRPRPLRRCPGSCPPRSMKAGAFTPATLAWGQVADRSTGIDLRSMKAGAFTPATPGPGRYALRWS